MEDVAAGVYSEGQLLDGQTYHVATNCTPLLLALVESMGLESHIINIKHHLDNKFLNLPLSI